MAEAPNGRLTLERPASSTTPSIADARAAISETRQRLAARVARTADHVHLVFTTPNSVGSEAPADGAVGGGIRMITAGGHLKRAGAR